MVHERTCPHPTVSRNNIETINKCSGGQETSPRREDFKRTMYYYRREKRVFAFLLVVFDRNASLLYLLCCVSCMLSQPCSWGSVQCMGRDCLEILSLVCDRLSDWVLETSGNHLTVRLVVAPRSCAIKPSLDLDASCSRTAASVPNRSEFGTFPALCFESN